MNVFWLNETSMKLEVFKKTKHSREVYKFLYWNVEGEEILLAGPITPATKEHKDLSNFTADIVPNGLQPYGAGTMEEGRITSWGSSGFKIITPESVRPQIKEALCSS